MTQPDHTPPAVADGRAAEELTPAEDALVAWIVAKVRRAYHDGARRFEFGRPDHVTAVLCYGPAEDNRHLIEE